ncbi:MAG: cobalamin-dependent protein [Thermodesulfobacteriota bacterium]
MDFQRKLFDLIVDADRTAANELIDEWAKVHGYNQAVVELLEPALRLLGEKWDKEEDVSLAQGYIAGKIAEDLMTKASQDRRLVTEETKGPVVMGNVEEDYHSLGRRLVVIFLEAAGWKVYDLGTDVPAAEFVDKAVEVGAKIIGASAMMYKTAANMKKLRKEIDRRGLTGRLQMSVGGAVFVIRPELAEEVGGDGTARNALAAPALMDRLWNKAMD